MTDEEKQKKKDYQKGYKKNMSHEQKQRYREARNKRDKDEYHSMTDEQKQKYLKAKKDRQKEYRKNMCDERGGFLSMFLGTLGASLLGNLLTGGKGVIRSGEGIFLKNQIY